MICACRGSTRVTILLNLNRATLSTRGIGLSRGSIWLWELIYLWNRSILGIDLSLKSICLGTGPPEKLPLLLASVAVTARTTLGHSIWRYAYLYSCTLHGKRSVGRRGSRVADHEGKSRLNKLVILRRLLRKLPENFVALMLHRRFP